MNNNANLNDKLNSATHPNPTPDREKIALQEKLEQLENENTALRSNVQHLENIISMMPGHVYWKNRDGIYMLCNDQVARVLQLQHRDNIKGKSEFDVVNAPYADAIYQTDNDIMKKGKPISLEEQGYDENGYPAIYLTKKVPVKNADGQVTGLFGLSIDITERKQAERELEDAKALAEIASQAKTDFIYNMSHDLRTPFSGILGFAYHLYETEMNATKKTELSYIIQSAEKLLALLNDILYVAKDGENNQFSSSTFDVLTLARECQTLFIAETQRKHIAIRIDYDKPHLSVKSDKHRLYRILVNLVSNAIKFTHQGSITIALSTQTSADQDYCLIRVIDTGIGIAKDKQKIIFDRFTRLQSSYRGDHSGSGIGLWFVKRLLEDLNGTIEVTSSENKGSTFTCRIPVQLLAECAPSPLSNTSLTSEMNATLPPPTAPLDAAAQQTEQNQALTRPKRILMVEDDDITQKMQAVILRDLGHHVDVANTAQKALEKAQNEYDLILLDIGLPDMDGFAVAKRIRELTPANKLTPIIGLTAHIGQMEQIQWQSKQVNRLILKPLTKSVCQTLTR